MAEPESAVRTLCLPLVNSTIELPSASRVAFFNATLLPIEARELIQETRTFLYCEQGLRPKFLQLQSAGYDVVAEMEAHQEHLPKDGFDVCMVACSKHKGANERAVQRAWERARLGGIILVAGDKTSGIAPLRKRIAATISIEDSLSKHHAVVFWMLRDDCELALDSGGSAQLTIGDTCTVNTAPGMFSHQKPDRGSKLLAEHFGPKLKGKVADFGAGWGYLGFRLLEACPDIAELASFEADHASLTAASGLLEQIEHPAIRTYHWHDLVSEPVRREFDNVIMNPPFHQGRSSEPGLGQAFIRAAGDALRPGGRLLMVANRQLPYEAMLGKIFGKVEMLQETDGFKVLSAWR